MARRDFFGRLLSTRETEADAPVEAEEVHHVASDDRADTPPGDASADGTNVSRDSADGIPVADLEIIPANWQTEDEGIEAVWGSVDGGEKDGAAPPASHSRAPQRPSPLTNIPGTVLTSGGDKRKAASQVPGGSDAARAGAVDQARRHVREDSGPRPEDAGKASPARSSQQGSPSGAPDERARRADAAAGQHPGGGEPPDREGRRWSLETSWDPIEQDLMRHPDVLPKHGVPEPASQRPSAQRPSAPHDDRAAADEAEPAARFLKRTEPPTPKPAERVQDEGDAHDPIGIADEVFRGIAEAERQAKKAEQQRVQAIHAEQDEPVRGMRDRVVTRLLKKKIVTPVQVTAAVKERDENGLKATLWRILAQQPDVDRETIYREAARTYAFTERHIKEDEIDLEFVRQVVEVFPERRRNRLIELRIVPVGYDFEAQSQALRVVFVTHDPSLPAARELMQELKLERYELQYVPEEAVREILLRAFPRKNEYLERISEDPLAYDLGTSYDEESNELIDEEALEAEINRSSLINLFEATLVEAVRQGASDIHIFPNADRRIEIHLRVDGKLKLWHTEDKVHPEALLAVIKDNSSNVDRFERDMAQDGFIQRKVDDALIRFRVSILPIATASQDIHAESIVIRVLDDRKVITDLARLGLLPGALSRFDRAIRQPHGMVILTGPTGSGKSTTLVASLHQVVTPDVNVLTVEDPVEYIIRGVRQIKLNHKLGLEGALRAILRHDPDIVMVGEMRDRPTAELAIKLANTGHLTFSTLHTNDAPSAISRLYKMGVEPFLIAYAINLVVAQRLIRTLCPVCKVEDEDPDMVLLREMGFTKEDLATSVLYKQGHDKNCKRCNGTGYKGRRAISEALYFSREIRHMIVDAHDKIDEDGIREQAKKEGMLGLMDSAREVVKLGETSVAEMMRITATDE